ncbi:MAG: sulfatase [Verrucomicrobiaceae bacterium]|nr:sulfatase [Verrucomicrobiaceae bacterium]
MIRLAISLMLVTGSLAKASPNLVLIVSDDHRYDLMGFHPESPEWLETPNLDKLATQGAHLRNAFVTTSLCSPSRASVLTGQYMHHHRVVDNQRPVPKGTKFFPQYLQSAGYHTAFIGKWHMGHDDDSPRPGFNHWVSFEGQGEYFNPTLNINGKKKQFQGYMTDVLTNQAIEWFEKNRPKDKPFLLYLSYKAVHYPFLPAPRHHGRYQDKPIPYPETMANSEENYRSQSKWIRERRYGIHGIDHMETGAFDKDPVPSFDNLYWRFCETIHGLDENVGRVIKTLKPAIPNTIMMYMGDNGFALGEHGFYDKRDAFEESIRIPLIAYAPGRIKPGTVISEMVQNIDIAPTLLNLAGVNVPPNAPRMDGQSFDGLLLGKKTPWRDHILYEYHWEWNFPATPTCLAIRTERYKYIYYHGVWDQNGFYDLKTDPHERHNLIQLPAHQEQIAHLRNQMFRELETSGGLIMPVRPPKGDQFYDRKLRR